MSAEYAYEKSHSPVNDFFTGHVASAAINESVGSHLPGRSDGPADAYRHVLLSAELTRRYGENYARFILSAHEFTGNMQDQTKEANEMDVHNNELGIKIGNRLRQQRGGSSWEDVVIEARKTIVPNDPNRNNARWLPQDKWKVNPKLDGKELPVGHKDVNWPVNWKPGAYSKYPIPHLEDYDTHHDQHSSLSPLEMEILGQYYPNLVASGGYIKNTFYQYDNENEWVDITKPLAKNASADEFREYGFAALLSDDDDKMHAALDSLLDSDVGRGLRQNADKVYAAQEREQEMARLAEEQARQVDAPVMRMGRG